MDWKYGRVGGKEPGQLEILTIVVISFRIKFTYSQSLLNKFSFCLIVCIQISISTLAPSPKKQIKNSFF